LGCPGQGHVREDSGHFAAGELDRLADAAVGVFLAAVLPCPVVRDAEPRGGAASVVEG
jgi:hypothetical protein